MVSRRSSGKYAGKLIFAPHDTRPTFQILFYSVITMDPTYTHMGSHDNLLGKPASKELETLYSNEKQVTAQTPPHL